ncbi:hypothetical protein CRYUN_Cryun25bG0077500 [Craigia yunnanensis]
MATSENIEIVEEIYKNTINSSSMNMDSNSAHTYSPILSMPSSIPSISIPSSKPPLGSTKKAKLMDVFEKLRSRIAITTDMRISNQNKGYMSITAHFLSDSWVLQSRILRFVYVPTPHTIDVLAQEWMTTLTQWNIETKLSTITLDNCSSNDAVAVVLDPRYKMKVVKYYFLKIYGDNGIFEIDQVKKTCYDLLHEYQCKASKQKSHAFYSSSLTSSIQTSSVPTSQQEDLSKLVAFLSYSSTSMHLKSELDHYLDEPVLPWTQLFDVLYWWKTNGIKYPTLQMIAKDFLVILISIVVPESAFSTSGRVVTSHRSRLHPDTLEALMCSQNWLKNEVNDR